MYCVCFLFYDIIPLLCFACTSIICQYKTLEFVLCNEGEKRHYTKRKTQIHRISFSYIRTIMMKYTQMPQSQRFISTLSRHISIINSQSTCYKGCPEKRNKNPKNFLLRSVSWKIIRNALIVESMLNSATLMFVVWIYYLILILSSLQLLCLS